MYLDPWAAVALFLLAAVGSLSILASVGVWIFTSGLPEGSVDDAVGETPSNVRVLYGETDWMTLDVLEYKGWHHEERGDRRILVHDRCGESHDPAATCASAS